MDYTLHEGQITLPEGFTDRTVNLFALGRSVPAPIGITISRDTLEPEEDLAGYLERQLKQLASRLRGYRVLDTFETTLGTDSALKGWQVDAQHSVESRPMYQRQAVFAMAERRVLILTLTSHTRLDAQQTRQWQVMLDSFRPQPWVPMSSEG